MQASIAIETCAEQALALHRAAAELRERRCNARLRQIALAQCELAEQQPAVSPSAQSLSTPLPFETSNPIEYAFAQLPSTTTGPIEYAFAQARPAQPDPADEELLQTLLIAGAQALPFGKAR